MEEQIIMGKLIIILTIFALILLIFLWGFVGKYQYYKDNKRAICDYGLMEELDTGKPNIYLCWLWHNPIAGTLEEIDNSTRNELNNIFGR